MSVTHHHQNPLKFNMTIVCYTHWLQVIYSTNSVHQWFSQQLFLCHQLKPLLRKEKNTYLEELHKLYISHFLVTDVIIEL
jgi:hypothetical protein